MRSAVPEAIEQSFVCVCFVANDQVQGTSSTNETLAEEGDWKSRGNELIPVYCGVMGLVIVSSIVYAVIKQRKQRIRKQKMKSSGRQMVPQTVTVTTSFPACSKTTHSASLGSPSDATQPRETLEPLLQTARRSDWSACVVSDEQALALCHVFEQQTDSDGISWWRRLANELGFDQQQIHEAEYQASSSAVHPLRVLLSRLACTSEQLFTQADLRDALLRIGRHDVCSILQLPAAQ